MKEILLKSLKEDIINAAPYYQLLREKYSEDVANEFLQDSICTLITKFTNDERMEKELGKYCWKWINMEMILMKLMNLLQISIGHTLMKSKNITIQDMEEAQLMAVTEYPHLEFPQMFQWEQ